MTPVRSDAYSVSAGEMKLIFAATGLAAVLSFVFINLTLSKVFNPPVGMAAATGALSLILSVPLRFLRSRNERPSLTRHLLASIGAAVVAGAATYALQLWL